VAPRIYGENGHSFQEGDVVFLKSGSMPMVVSLVLSANRVQVIWQNYYGEMRMKEFSTLILTATQPQFSYPREDDECD
jgi:uncharacterized protein YodC (DUF2158 family)